MSDCRSALPMYQVVQLSHIRRMLTPVGVWLNSPLLKVWHRSLCTGEHKVKVSVTDQDCCVSAATPFSCPLSGHQSSPPQLPPFHLSTETSHSNNPIILPPVPQPPQPPTSAPQKRLFCLRAHSLHSSVVPYHDPWVHHSGVIGASSMFTRVLNRAAFYDNAEEARCLMGSLDRKGIKALDPHGNTVSHRELFVITVVPPA